ncbi:MAG: hypothetical protein ABIK31_01640 [candidate division WOR-3 bacterium]
MGIIYNNGTLIIEEEYHINFPLPGDFSLPSIPTLPPVSFPDVPDLPGDLQNILDYIEELKLKQLSVPSVSIDYGGSVNLETGGYTPKTSYLPSSSLDFNGFIESLLSNFSVDLPSIPTLPPVSFPDVPDFSLLFGNLGIDPQKFLVNMNDPDYPQYGYNPNLPIIRVKVYQNGVLII